LSLIKSALLKTNLTRTVSNTY